MNVRHRLRFKHGTWLTYMATRPNRNSTFDNISAVAAFNPGAADPFLMPDGLSRILQDRWT